MTTELCYSILFYCYKILAVFNLNISCLTHFYPTPPVPLTPHAMQLSVHGLIVADESAISSIASKIRSAVEDVEKEAGALSGLQVLRCTPYFALS